MVSDPHVRRLDVRPTPQMGRHTCEVRAGESRPLNSSVLKVVSAPVILPSRDATAMAIIASLSG